MSLFARLNIFHRIQSWKDNVLRVLKALEEQNANLAHVMTDMQTEMDSRQLYIDHEIAGARETRTILDRILNFEQDIAHIRETRSMLELMKLQMVELRDVILIKASQEQNGNLTSAISGLQAIMESRLLHFEQEIGGIRETLSMLEQLQAELVELRDLMNDTPAEPQLSNGLNHADPIQELMERLSRSSIEWELRFNRIELNHRELRDRLKLDRDFVAEFRTERKDRR